uniref:Uncharacterized protein n=1 Tax=Brassica oleracea var. oleracea TaxID=109376 RepID=A0A0D3DL82_BRAOL
MNNGTMKVNPKFHILKTLVLEVLTAQLKDKDDRISLLETQMAAQQAGYEAQRRLNQQMMEMMQRMYPNEVFPDVPDPNGVPRNIPRDMFLGIFRGPRSSEFSDENSEEHFVGTSEDWTIGKSIEISRGSSPSVYSEEISDEQVVLGISSEIWFLGIPSENSEEFPRKNEFPRSYFRGLVSSPLQRKTKFLLKEKNERKISIKHNGYFGTKLDTFAFMVHLVDLCVRCLG